MSAYNKTAATSTLYDYTGTPSDQNIGDGTALRVCFSLGGAQGRMDMCIKILSDATPEGRWIWAYDDIAGGTFISNLRKAPSQCSEVNVKAISSSVYAGLEADQTKRILRQRMLRPTPLVTEPLAGRQRPQRYRLRISAARL